MILAGIPEQSDLSGYWLHDLSDAAAQTPQGCPTSDEELLPIKKEFIMVLVAKLIKRMETSFNKGSKVLPELSVGDRVRVQNLITLRMIRYNKTGMVMKKLRDRQYKIVMDSSCRVTVRNRRHLRKVEKPVEEDPGMAGGRG